MTYSEEKIKPNIEKIIIIDKDDPEVHTEVKENNDPDTILKAHKVIEDYIEKGHKVKAELHYRGTVLRIGFLASKGEGAS